MSEELIAMRAADTSVDVDGVIGLEMTVNARAATAEMASSTAAAKLHQASCVIWERASCGIALLVQSSLAAVGGALLRAVGSMSLSHWCRQLFELEQHFSGRAAPFAVALVVGFVVVLACERQREKRC
eukprot:6782505-Prymnesium_polylepis.1